MSDTTGEANPDGGTDEAADEITIPNYVMVPIPDVYVPAVMGHVLMLMAKETVQQWEPEEVTKFFAEADEPAKAVLASVARGTVSAMDVIADEVADKTQIPLGEVMRIVRDLNETAKLLKRPALIAPKSGQETLANGRTITRRLLEMNERLAPMVVDAEKSDIAANPHPLPGPE